MATLSIHTKTTASVVRCVFLLALGWHLSAAPAAADIGTASLTSTNSTSAILTFSHSGYEAHAFLFGKAKDYKYLVCWRQLNQLGLACNWNALPSNSQQVQLTNLTVGLPINITIQCWCGKEWKHLPPGPFGDHVVANMNYTHQLPPSPSGPSLVSSTNVRVRGVQSGQCLFINSSSTNVRGWSCWADPAMVFALETFSDGSKRLRHTQSGLCITAVGQGSFVRARPCGSDGSELLVIPLAGPGGSPVLVRFIFTSVRPSGQFGRGRTFGNICLMANAADGADAMTEDCNVPGAALPLMLDPV